MQRYNGQLINQFANAVNGNAAAGAQVTVKVKSSGATATLYATSSLGGGTLPNPLTTDSRGYFGFYAPDGVYTLDFNIAGTPQQEIQLQDVADLQAQFDNALANAGYIPVGTFTAGCTVSQSNGVVSDGTSYWRWDGALPKTVTAGSSPTPTGVGNWILVSDGALKNDLAAANSTVLVGGVEAGNLADRAKVYTSLEDYSGTPLQKLQAAYNSGATYIKATLPSYDFGAITGNTVLFTATRFVDIDFQGAEVKVQSQNTSAFTETAFIRFSDTNGNVRNFVFDDEAFLFAGPSRGAQPIQIYNSAANTSGYTFENILIKRGQSLFTAFSANPLTARARNIFLVGRIEGVSTYYGVNLANNGDNLVGSYKVGDFNRAFFAYGTDGVDIQYVAETGQPSSGALLISSTGSSAPATQNYKIRAEYKSLNGNVCIKGQTAADTGVYRNIDIDLTVLALNTNKTTAYFFSLGDDAAASGTYTVENLSLKLYSTVEFLESVRVATDTPNITRVNVLTNGSRVIGGYENALKRVNFNTTTQGYFAGNLTTGNVLLSNRQIGQGKNVSSLFACELSVVGYNDTSFAGQRLFMAKYLVSGYISSGGAATITGNTEISRVNVGASPYPVVTITGTTGGITVAADTYTNATSRLCVTCTALRV